MSIWENEYESIILLLCVDMSRVWKAFSRPNLSTRQFGFVFQMIQLNEFQWTTCSPGHRARHSNLKNVTINGGRSKLTCPPKTGPGMILEEGSEKGDLTSERDAHTSPFQFRLTSAEIWLGVSSEDVNPTGGGHPEGGNRETSPAPGEAGVTCTAGRDWI